MKFIEQSWSWMQLPRLPLELIESAGRTCYKSEDKMTPNSAIQFTEMVLKRGHESVIEHASASVRFITNRGVTHELVRHRLCAFSQESTRYVNYGGDDIEFILPVWMDKRYLDESYTMDECSWADRFFIGSCHGSEVAYKSLLRNGWRPEQAREILPNALKTEIVVTANLREWRHILKLRTSKAAHPQIRNLMDSCLEGFKDNIPVLFEDI